MQKCMQPKIMAFGFVFTVTIAMTTHKKIEYDCFSP